MSVVTLTTRRIIGIVVVLVVLFVLGFVIGWVSKRSDDDSSGEDFDMKYIANRRRDEMKAKTDFHEKLFKMLNADQIGANLRHFSKHPHIGGTKRTKELAEEIARRWRNDYKFDKVEQPKYRILLPYINPNVSNSVQILNSGGTAIYEYSGKEKLVDPSENDSTMIPPLLGYAKQGSAKGKLLYVNYGTWNDFQMLKLNFGISNCSGYIVIMRYADIYRGDQVEHAQDCGAEGAIIYHDPADYAPEGQNNVYPQYIWLPRTGVQRGSIIIGRGDPLTPGLPSVEGVFRLPVDKANLPKIPATPMPWGNAVELLKLMEGRDVPKSWQGALNITYKLGDGGMKNNTVKITVNIPNIQQDTYNVIGTIYGREEPDRWVLIGNHRDSWGFGAVDASSGTSAILEISRGLGELLKQGWRPRRTIKFCSWGAEESGIIGSTEWIEENERALSTKAITYINVDIAVYGNLTFQLAGSPLLKKPMIGNVKKVPDPHGGNVYDQMIKVKKKFDYWDLGSGSDYASFYHFVGVPSLDMSYVGKVFYPVYHTVHDTYKWLQSLIDPKFEYHLTTAKIASKILFDSADSLVLPLDVTEYGKSLDTSFKALRKNYGIELLKKNVSLKYIEEAIAKFKDEATKFESEKAQAIDKKDDIRLRALNDRMVNVEKAFITAGGLPNRPNTRHVLFAPSIHDAYVSTTFPGITDLVAKENKTDQDWMGIKEHTSIVFKAISEATNTLKADEN